MAVKNRLVPSVILTFIVGLASMLGTIACGVGQVVVGGLLSGAYVELVEDETPTPMDAITRSWELFKPHWLMITALFFVASIVAGLGTIACYIGVLFTYPILTCCMSVTYLGLKGTPMQPQAPENYTPTQEG